jgi:hypothetical protein
MDIFNQVFTLKTANEIWLKLHELHDGTSNVREQKHCLVLNEYSSFAMKDNELVRDMYSRLNLITNELNSIGINKLGDADIVRKIISLLPQQRYGSIITILHNMEDLSNVGAKAETPPFARSLRCLAAALTETKQARTPFASIGTRRRPATKASHSAASSS